MERIIGWIEVYDWNNPLTFLYIALGYFLFAGHWRIAAPAMIALVLVTLLPDLTIINLVTGQQVMSFTMVVYILGIVLSCITAIHAFVRYMLT